MAKEIDVKLENLKKLPEDYQKICGKLEGYNQSIQDVSERMKGYSHANVRKTLSDIVESSDTCITEIGQLKNTLMFIMIQYINTEKEILGIKSENAKKTSGESSYSVDLDQGSWWEELFGDIKQDIGTSLIESSGNTIVKIAGAINVATSIARSTGQNAFVVINPQVAKTTSKMISTGKAISTGAKFGFPVIGGIIDFLDQKKQGEDTKDAAIKATAHAGIGIAAGVIVDGTGALIASTNIGATIGTAFGPVGTIAGAAIGLVMGTAITLLISEGFDYIYDNWDGIKETATQIVEKSVNVVGKAIDGIGNALEGTFENLGTVFA